MKILLTLNVSKTVFEAISELLPVGYELTILGNLPLNVNTIPANFPDLLRIAMIDLCKQSNEIKKALAT